MKRFECGDLAITCNSRAPEINDGHLVTILEVLGPVPNLGPGFWYRIERLDGQSFLVYREPGSQECEPGGPRVRAEQHNLRPLRERQEDVGAETREEMCA